MSDKYTKIINAEYEANGFIAHFILTPTTSSEEENEEQIQQYSFHVINDEPPIGNASQLTSNRVHIEKEKLEPAQIIIDILIETIDHFLQCNWH